MRRLLYMFLLPAAALAVSLHSCVKMDQMENTPQGNLYALWKIIDEHYCYFDYKGEEYGLDWDRVLQTHATRISPATGAAGLFEVCCDMLSELRDGHVNLYASHDVGRYWKWYLDYPMNFSEEVQRNYLTDNYFMQSGMKYVTLPSNCGYLYIPDFSVNLQDGALNNVFSYFATCHALIIDVRGNGGGNAEVARKLASRFTEERVMVGTRSHKTGPGHSDFSDPTEIYVDPSSHIRWQKPVFILTNRGCFSATNQFVSDMKRFPNVTVVGDTTGGGGGMPASMELPNGWVVRFSSVPYLDAQGNHVEFGVAPHVRADMGENALTTGVDSIIEVALELVRNQIK